MATTHHLIIKIMIGATTRGPYASVMARVRTAAMMDDSGHQLVFEGRAGWTEGRGGLHEFAKVQHRRDEHRARVFEPMIVETGTKGEKKLQVKKNQGKNSFLHFKIMGQNFNQIYLLFIY